VVGELGELIVSVELLRVFEHGPEEVGDDGLGGCIGFEGLVDDLPRRGPVAADQGVEESFEQDVASAGHRCLRVIWLMSTTSLSWVGGASCRAVGASPPWLGVHRRITGRA